MSKHGDEDWVLFRIGDVYLPSPKETIGALTEEALLVGKLTGYSDSGSDQAAFGVLDLGGTLRVIVPRQKLSRVYRGEQPVREEDSGL